VSAERFVEVHCHFERYDNQLLPGMYMNAHVELDGTKGLVVPNEAIQRFEGREYIFVRRTNQQFEMLEVKRIANNGQSSSLSSPQLNPNLEIVTKGAYTLLMKLKNTEAE
jgi:cobalt-zinc-cadmium efflux system membrane fusion protein